MNVTLIVGHKSTSPGAQNIGHSASEYEFNSRLALDIWRAFFYGMGKSEIKITIVHRRTFSTLPGDVNRTQPDFAVSMHANASFSAKASGSEVFYYHRSAHSAKIAAIFQHEFLDALGLDDRGIKGIDSEDRGGYLLKNVSAPIVLCEPFFIDNEFDLMTANGSDLAGAYIRAIKSASEL